MKTADTSFVELHNDVEVTSMSSVQVNRERRTRPRGTLGAQRACMACPETTNASEGEHPEHHRTPRTGRALRFP